MLSSHSGRNDAVWGQQRRNDMQFKLIVSMVKATVTEKIVEAAKSAGGTGATIIPARGTGIHEAKTFFGLTLETHTDVVLFLVAENIVEPVLEAIYKKGRFEEPGHRHCLCGRCAECGRP